MTSSTEARGRIAVVPARGGSKRIPRKNIVDFHGKPMIHWPLEMLLSSGGFEAVVVSTDDPEIASVATQAGPVHIVERPADLAGDEVPTAPVVVHAVEEIERRLGLEVQVVTVLYPTSVFTTHEHLAEADSLLASSGARLVMSVGRFRSPLARAWSRSAAGLMERLDPARHLRPSQSLPEAFFDAGQFYISDRTAWRDWEAEPTMAVCGLVLSAIDAIDMDSPADLQFAREVFNLRLKSHDRRDPVKDKT